MNAATLLILAGSIAGALSLLEKPFGASGIYNNQNKEKIPGYVIAILKTIDVSMGNAGRDSLVEYANFIWQYYDLNTLQFKPNAPETRWKRGLKEEVLNSHSFFIPFKMAFEIEDKIKNPNSVNNSILLNKAINHLAYRPQPEDIFQNYSVRKQRFYEICHFILQNYNYKFNRIIWNDSGQIEKVDYSTSWKKGITIPDYPFFNPPTTIEDLIYAFSALVQTGNSLDEGGEGVISYLLMAQNLYDEFFHLFLYLDNPEWEPSYLSKPVVFPNFKSDIAFNHDIPDLNSNIAPYWAKYFAIEDDQTAMNIQGIIKDIVASIRPFSKDVFTMYKNTAKPPRVIYNGNRLYLEQIISTLNKYAFFNPYKVYAQNFIESPVYENFTISTTWGDWTISQWQTAGKLPFVPCSMEYLNNQIKAAEKFNSEGHNFKFLPAFPLFNFPVNIPSGTTQEKIIERNTILSRRKYFKWYFKHN